MLKICTADESLFTVIDSNDRRVSWKLDEILKYCKNQPEVIIDLRTFYSYAMSLLAFEFDASAKIQKANLREPIILGSGTITQLNDGVEYQAPIILMGKYGLLKALQLGVRYQGVKILQYMPPPIEGVSFPIGKLQYQKSKKLK